MNNERIQIGRKSYLKFIPYGREITDGTCRCISCGQIDEIGFHDAKLCPGLGGTLPLSEKAKAFAEANKTSPVVYGSGQPGGGGYYRLKNGQRFRLFLYDCRSLPRRPNWDIAEAA